MKTWRFGQGFGARELARALALAERAPSSFAGASTSALGPTDGWNQVASLSVVGEDGPAQLEKARQLLESFQFSDPRIARPYFDPHTPFAQRTILFELKGMGFHFLSPIRITQVVEPEEGRPRFAFCIETVSGHIERGQEWISLEYQPASRRLSLGVSAVWRGGDIPNVLIWLGVELFLRRYQRAWHRLVHTRTRAFLHAPHHVPAAPVQWMAVRAIGRWEHWVSSEVEHMRADRLMRVWGLSALTGARSLAPWAAASRCLFPNAPRARQALALAAGAELVMDKLPGVPARICPLPWGGRILSGASLAFLLTKRRGRRRLAVSLLGGAAAWASTWLCFGARRGAALRWGPTRAALAEDLATLGLAAALTPSAIKNLR